MLQHYTECSEFEEKHLEQKAYHKSRQMLEKYFMLSFIVISSLLQH